VLPDDPVAQRNVAVLGTASMINATAAHSSVDHESQDHLDTPLRTAQIARRRVQVGFHMGHYANHASTNKKLRWRGGFCEEQSVATK
jgi:hypothetical protein